MEQSATYSFALHISKLLEEGEKLDWAKTRKIAKDFDVKTDTETMQACELAVVLESRRIAHNGNSVRQQFEEQKDLYERQVSIKPLDTKSRVLQQYSTPCPLAYLLGRFVLPKDYDDPWGYFLEPSAGNGMLTVALPKERTIVNEIDEIRAENLRQQGFKNVTMLDASDESKKPKDVFTGIITNPPFAKLTEKDKIERHGWLINTLDYKMSVLALDRMDKDGKAAIIVGGKLWNAYWKPVSERSDKKVLYGQWKTFLGYLYAQYNVVDVIYVDGDHIYQKQGTTYPIAVILIDGRHEYDEGNKPRYVFDDDKDTIIQTFDQLFDRIFPYLHAKDVMKPKLETTKMMIFWWYKDGVLFKNDGWYRYDREIIRKKAEKCTKHITIKCFIREDDYNKKYHTEHTITLHKPSKKDTNRGDRQKKAKALILKMKMAKARLNYIPPEIFRNLGLAGTIDTTQTSKRILQQEYKLIRKMGDDLSKKNPMYRKAYDWCRNLTDEHFSSAFTAALMVQKAGFTLPRIKASSTDIRERGVGGQFTVSPYWQRTTIQLSTSSFFATKGGLDVAFEESYKQRWNSTPNCALHELCHHIMFLVDDETNQMHRSMTETYRSAARNNVSGYASQKFCEFCAETVSGILYGIKYPDNVIDLLPKGDWGTEKENMAFQKLKDMGRKGSVSGLGSFIPVEILEHLSGVKDIVTPGNFDWVTYTDEQRKTDIFGELGNLIELKGYYASNSFVHCAIDNWCKIMNKTFDFMLPIDMNKLRKARALMLQIKMVKAKFNI